MGVGEKNKKHGAEGEILSPSTESLVKDNGTVEDKEKVSIPGKCEFWVDYSSITKDVLPPTPAEWYTHYEADSGKCYVDFCIAFKNWEGEGIMADEVVSAKLTYATKYEYDGFSTIEEQDRGNFTYTNITSISPLCTEYIHYLFEVPEEVETSKEPVSVSFKIGGNEYLYTVR